LPNPAAGQAGGKNRKQLLRKRRATPRALRATFADDDVVADAVERPEIGAAACRAQTAAKFEANHETKHAVRPPAKHGPNLVMNRVSSHGTTA
jgi:hypothetical protein